MIYLLMISVNFREFEEHTSEDEEGEEDEGGEEDEEIIVEDLCSVLDQSCSDLNIILPPHHRCACHSLNRIAVSDCEKATKNATFARLHKSAFSKCNALWSKQNRSTQAADKIHELLGVYLMKSNVTR